MLLSLKLGIFHIIIKFTIILSYLFSFIIRDRSGILKLFVMLIEMPHEYGNIYINGKLREAANFFNEEQKHLYLRFIW